MLIPTILGVVLTMAPVGSAALPALVVTVVLDIVALGGVWLAMRPGRPDIRAKGDLDHVLRGGRPVVVELYSNFCLICMAYRQTVRTAAMSLGASCTFARVELPSRAGTEIGDGYGVRYTPSFLIFDEHGDLVRTIIPDNVTPLANGYRVLDDQRRVVTRLSRVTPEDLIAMVRASQ